MHTVESVQRLVATVKRNNKRSSAFPQKTLEQSPRTAPLHLPPELWGFILRLATSSCVDTTGTVSFLSLAHSHCHLYQRLAHYRAVMHTKTRLSLISKAWFAYTQEILFESVWISRAREARALAQVLSGTGPNAGCGKYIRRLHIETPTLERCDPADLRNILDCAPRLEVYSDHRSVRRNINDINSCGSRSRSSPRELLSALAHPNNSIRRLSWTNYDDVSFHLHMSPMLETTAARLEFLELTFCAAHLQSIAKSSSLSLPTSIYSSFSCPDFTPITLTLPSLRSLKVTLDNATFQVLATWHMPSLRNLSVLSADFSYASSGFSDFFAVHGPKLTQLELGHSSSTIEEHYLTYPSHSPPPVPSFSIPLAEWCPNLKEFICSADAEWNWQNPDWIAPHVLLPTHPSLELIGIRDIDKRLRDDRTEYFGLLEQVGSLLRREAFPSLRYVRDMSWESDGMRRGVRLVRERAETSRVRTRRFGFRVRERASEREKDRGSVSRETLMVLRFWERVLERCREAGVWLEDYRGFNVTVRDLRRAEAGKGDVGEFEGC
ncbi:hypothetical protein H2248_000048 [Termitomyces sp. 'cryptogamus']|nr:hypothetical protein H2248_000048 [Termitomyces sp. 'cryptogamus']